MGTQINQLSAMDSLEVGDLIPIWDTSNGDTRKAALSLLRQFILDISSLTNNSIVLEDADTIAVYDNSGGTNVQANVTAIRNYVASNLFTSLSSGADLADADTFIIYDASAAGTVKITGALVKAYIQTNLFSGLTAETTVAGDDKLVMYDTSATGTRSTTLANVLTYLQTNLFNTLAELTTIADDDKIVIYDASGTAVKYVTSLNMLNYIKPTTQTASPSATGFNVAITDSSEDIHLILTPADGYATGTITLPATLSCIDKQEILVNCSEQVAALTVAGNGSTVIGAPQALGADSSFKLKYNLANTTWYKVG